MNKHDYQEVDYDIVSLTNGFDTDILYKYKCRRCGKVIQSISRRYSE